MSVNAENNNRILDTLAKQFAKKSNVHAYIVQTEAPLISELLKSCAYIAMCEKQGCGECSVCKKIKSGNHSDVYFLPSRDKTDNLDKMTVADAQKIIDESALRPADGERKVFLIDASQRSLKGVATANWQNKLLKTLEEPNGYSYVFIGVEKAQMLLPTIVSRCQILTAERLTAKQMLGYLDSSGFNAEVKQLAAVLANGSEFKAEKVLHDNNYYRIYRNCLDLLTKMTSTKVALPYSTMLVKDAEYAEYYFEILTALLMQSLAFRLNEEDFVLTYVQPQIEEICANYSIEATLAVIELLQDAKTKFDRQIKFAILVDNLLVSILEVRYRCRT